MSLEFLSDEWFAKVKEIRDGAGNVEAPAALADLVINITVPRHFIEGRNWWVSHMQAAKAAITTMSNALAKGRRMGECFGA